MSFLRWPILLLALFLSHAACAQIYYIAVDGAGAGHLRRINPDGTGDTTLTLPFLTSVSNPYWSNDGALLALTAVDSLAHGQHSTNVFGYSPTNGALTQLTDFTDIFGQNFFSYTFPLYKAFSPNRGQLAVFSLVQTRGGGSSGGSDLPVLKIFTGGGNPIEVLQDSDRSYITGGDHGGEGVDWSPTQNLLVAPLTTMVPYLSNPSSSGGVTAIYRIVPEANAKLNGHIQRITSPRTDFNINNGTLWAEHDYMPRFSPNGAAIAFVRSFQSISSSSGQPNPDQQTLHILNLANGADTQIAGPFPSGVYITTIDWSPNGAALIFDLGLQPNSVNGPQQGIDPHTDQTYVINTNGTGLRQLLGNNHGQPSWRPTATVTGGTGRKSDFNSDGFADYVLLSPATHQTAVWFLQNGVFRSGVFGPKLPAGYVLVSTTDINLDGKSDYVLFNPTTRQSAIWFMNGTALVSGAYGPSLPAGWTLVAASDINRDSHPDYVLFNPTTRQTVIWFLNGAGYAGGTAGPTLPAGWALADVNDFNADGKPDYVLVNSATHQTAIWFMNGAALLNGAIAPTLPAGWTLAGTADFDRDGKSDFVLANPTTRQTVIWHMSGVTRISAAFGPTVAAGYTLASP